MLRVFWFMLTLLGDISSRLWACSTVARPPAEREASLWWRVKNVPPLIAIFWSLERSDICNRPCYLAAINVPASISIHCYLCNLSVICIGHAICSITIRLCIPDPEPN